MVDQAIETAEAPSFEVAPVEKLETAVTKMGKGLKKDLQERGEVGLDELLNRVYSWENKYGEKLTDDEFEVFTILSLAIGTVKVVYEKKVGKERIPEEAALESIATQQEIVRMTLGNLDNDNRPRRGLMRSFALVTEIFEGYFDPEKGRIKEEAVYTEEGFWQGVQGMVTTALMFNEEGWEVKLPPPELDLKDEIDLLVKNDEGKIYGVDVTAKRPHIIDKKGNLSPPFYVEKVDTPDYTPSQLKESINGFIKVNVPPLRHNSSEDFYEDRMTGFPSKKALGEFNNYLNS